MKTNKGAREFVDDKSEEFSLNGYTLTIHYVDRLDQYVPCEYPGLKSPMTPDEVKKYAGFWEAVSQRLTNLNWVTIHARTGAEK